MKNNEFTEMFKYLRENAGLSFRTLATNLGLSSTYIFDIENGNREPNEKLIELLISYYKLNSEQQRILYDAVANSTGNLPFDVIKYLKENPDEIDKVIQNMQENNFKKMWKFAHSKISKNIVSLQNDTFFIL